MIKDEDFKLLRIQTITFKVNIHCDGCKQKVKKLLQRTEGVYTVTIEAEQQKVTVSGNVDSAALIKMLARAGKHAELWNQKPNNSFNHQNHKSNNNQQKQQILPMKDNFSKGKNGNETNNNIIKNQPQTTQNLIQSLKIFEGQHKKPEPFSSDDDFSDEDEDDNNDNENDLGFLRDKLNQLNMLKQANTAALPAANAKRNGDGASSRGEKKGVVPNQNYGGMKNLIGPELKGMNGSTSNFVNNPTMDDGVVGNGGGHQGLNSGFPSSAIGTDFVGVGIPPGQGQHLPMIMNFHGSHAHPSSMTMNNNLMGSKHMQQQRVMYNRSPRVAPYTCYYPNPYYNYNINNSSSYQSEHYSAHHFGDENTGSCAVM